MPQRATSSPAGDSTWGSRMNVAGCAKRGDAKPSRGRGQSLTMASARPRLELAAQRGHRVRQALHVSGGAVDREARPQGAHDAEALHERLGAVVSRADRDAVLVEERGAVVGVNAVD